MEKIVTDFGEPVIKEWTGHLPHEVYPYSVNPVAKPGWVRATNEGKNQSESLIHYIDKDIDPALSNT